MDATADLFERWLDNLRQRYLAELTFAEVTRALCALSADYVERRNPAAGVRSTALDGRGKRAAFALFYGPLHFLVVKQVTAALDLRLEHARVVDLGCGTGAAGAALASRAGPTMEEILAVDRQGWALDEAARAYRHFGARFRTLRLEASKVRFPPGSLIVAAYTVNELAGPERAALLRTLSPHLDRGGSCLIVEPIARALTSWWPEWIRTTERFGARTDEWRFRAELPEPLRLWDRAAGLDHREQTARSLWIPPAGA